MPQKSLNRIIHGDCVEEIIKLDDASIDLMVTSPPYNVDLGNNKFNKDSYASHDDNMPYDDYILWLIKIFFLLKPKMKDDGRLVINIGDGKNGLYPTHSHIIQFMIDLGYQPFTTIIWDKKNCSSRTSWGSWQSPSNPSFPTPFEYILVFYNRYKKKQTKGETDIRKDEFIKNSYAIWQFPGEKKSKLGHPAPFPLDLPLRCIKQLSWIGDTVLDPFAGSGTTGVACKRTNRNYILIEKDEKYIPLIKQRVNQLNIGDFTNGWSGLVHGEVVYNCLLCMGDI